MGAGNARLQAHAMAGFHVDAVGLNGIEMDIALDASKDSVRLDEGLVEAPQSVPDIHLESLIAVSNVKPSTVQPAFNVNSVTWFID